METAAILFFVYVFFKCYFSVIFLCRGLKLCMLNPYNMNNKMMWWFLSKMYRIFLMNFFQKYKFFLQIFQHWNDPKHKTIHFTKNPSHHFVEYNDKNHLSKGHWNRIINKGVFAKYVQKNVDFEKIKENVKKTDTLLFFDMKKLIFSILKYISHQNMVVYLQEKG